MGDLQVEVQGVEALVSKLDKLSNVGRRSVLIDAMKKAAKPIRDTARAKAPVLTGHLRDSIVIEEVKDVQTLSSNPQVGVIAGPGEGLGSRRTFYAHMQEFGTVHHAPTPFMRPAFDGEQRQAQEIARQELSDRLTREARG